MNSPYGTMTLPNSKKTILKCTKGSTKKRRKTQNGHCGMRRMEKVLWLRIGYAVAEWGGRVWYNNVLPSINCSANRTTVHPCSETNNRRFFVFARKNICDEQHATVNVTIQLLYTKGTVRRAISRAEGDTFESGLHRAPMSSISMQRDQHTQTCIQIRKTSAKERMLNNWARTLGPPKMHSLHPVPM
jgi:hypothetical protein